MKKVTLYPELIASFLRINLEKEFLAWNIIRTINDSAGVVNYSDIVNIISNIFNISKTQSYQIAKNGTNIFWRKSNNNKKSQNCGLVSLSNVIKYADINITKTKPFEIPAKIFFQTSAKENKNFLISLVASRYAEYKPLSIKIIAENTGLSETTVRNALHQCPYVKITSNFNIIESFTTLDDVKSHRINNARYKIENINGKYNLLRQDANFYEIICFDRKSLKSRPKELKNKTNTFKENIPLHI